MKPVIITVSPAEALSRHRRLFDALAELFSIQFEARDGINGPDRAAAILLGVDCAEAIRVAGMGVPCLAYLKDEPVAAKSETADISMTPMAYLDQSFRGRKIPDRSIKQVRPLKPEEGDEVVAHKGGDVLWVHRLVGSVSLDLLAVDPPVLGDNDYPYQHYQRDNFMRLLPLFYFLRRRSPWQRPPLRGCLMFDDPNLHWRTYGCVRFEELARHAREHNYHAAFATVPYDGWHVNPAAAALFREHKDRLSLLIHGNNHTYAELAQPYPDGHARALMAQALQRIARMEKRSGLEIPRVMAAPHGGCSREMADAMLAVGFEAATISRWSLMHYNRNKWYGTIGLNLAEFLGAAFPIIPRFKLAHEREVDIYLNALLQRPLILVGHHDDVGGGLGIMETFASRVNSTGQVKWMNMQTFARSHFCTHQDGDALHVKLFTRRVNITVPPGISHLIIHRAWDKTNRSEPLQWRNGSAESVLIKTYSSEAIPVKPGTEIEVASIFPGVIDPHQVAPPHTSIWAGLRRGLCEVRDRTRPALNRLRKSGKPAMANAE